MYGKLWAYIRLVRSKEPGSWHLNCTICWQRLIDLIESFKAVKKLLNQPIKQTSNSGFFLAVNGPLGDDYARQLSGYISVHSSQSSFTDYCQALANYSNRLLILNIQTVEPTQNVFPPGLLCCSWPPSWLRPTRPLNVSPGPLGRPELRARTASAPTSDGWQTTYPPSGCRAPTSTFSPHLTSSTRRWRSVSLASATKEWLKIETRATIDFFTDVPCIMTDDKWGRESAGGILRKYFPSRVSLFASPELAEYHTTANRR